MTMLNLSLVCLISFFTFFSFSYPATDTLTSLDTLGDIQTLVSSGGIFKLGLFSENFSGYHYLGIWFTADPKKVVWVDRENPILDSSGLLQIQAGNLVLTDRRQVQLIVNSGSVAAVSTNTSATLHDTGNFVLKEVYTGTIIWQSFDLPSDTYLPGMKLGLHTRTPSDMLRDNQTLVSSGGLFEFGFFGESVSGYYLGIWFTADPSNVV
ncbi:hypothetical protein PRUPE_1G474300 [Prunus persica]|uniref:Bulb-type lectin domain-containing protein n=1 Tax=Prunus persica TaxID=3760 RepID=A0A251RE91_PRUPE|nr:hypothetical protein PRUPE_1G474300 [Prunus persica]